MFRPHFWKESYHPCLYRVYVRDTGNMLMDSLFDIQSVLVKLLQFLEASSLSRVGCKIGLFVCSLTGCLLQKLNVGHTETQQTAKLAETSGRDACHYGQRTTSCGQLRSVLLHSSFQSLGVNGLPLCDPLGEISFIFGFYNSFRFLKKKC